jgi:hypothetical protein
MTKLEELEDIRDAAKAAYTTANAAYRAAHKKFYNQVVN